MINSLIKLADGLDSLGLDNYVDVLDQIISRAAKREDDFEDLLKLFDAPVKLEDDEDDIPGEKQVMPEEESEVHTLPEELDTSLTKEEVGSNRLDMLKRRHELLRLKKKQEDKEKLEEALSEVPAEKDDLPVLSPDDELDESFEDEGVGDGNNADDSLIETLKDKLKQTPELAKQLLQLVKENPELLQLLALQEKR